MPDGVLHGLEGVLGATAVGAAALADVGLATTATAEGLSGHAYQLAGVETTVTGALGGHDDNAWLVDCSADHGYHRGESWTRLRISRARVRKSLPDTPSA